MGGPNPDEIDLSDEDVYDRDNDDYEVASDPTMAATLGFTSFGGAKPSDNVDKDDSHAPKKRRFNPHSDETVIPGPGSDTTKPALTAHRAQLNNKPQTTATEEINYGDEITYDSDDDFELDTNAPLELDAALTPSGTSTPAAAVGYPGPQSQPATGMPPPPSTSTRGDRGDGRGANRGGRGTARGGAHANPLWYVDYYDPSSNENPWEGMEKYKSLEPVGTWLPRYWDTVASATGAAGAGAATDVGTGTREAARAGVAAAASG